MAERLKAAVLKTVVRQRTVGSNPTSSAIEFAPVPQLDRGADYESDRRGFESLRAHHLASVAPILRAFLFPYVALVRYGNKTHELLALQKAD